MKPVTIAILLLGVAMIFLIVLKRQTMTKDVETHPVTTETITDTPPVAPDFPPPPVTTETSEATNAPMPPDGVLTTENALSPEAIAEKVQHLETLGMNDDAASLNTILAELRNPQPQIREAARDAAVQFGDPAAIPALKKAANQTEDVDEKILLLQAVKFLELPPLRVPQPN